MAPEYGDAVRGDSAIRQGAHATGGGGGENLAREQGDEVTADSVIRRGAEAGEITPTVETTLRGHEFS